MEINGDEVTLHNVRNFDYRTETDYTPRLETRTVRLSQLTGVDLAINYWGSPWMAHAIASFQFADAPPVCFSIETRKQVGESYSAMDHERLKRDVADTFARRATHPLPPVLEPPPNFWRPTFEKMAAECGIDPDIAHQFERVREFYAGLISR